MVSKPPLDDQQSQPQQWDGSLRDPLCTGERPICARCQKQGKDCVYANATTSWSYIATLEERVRQLESEKAEWINRHGGAEISGRLAKRPRLATSPQSTPSPPPFPPASFDSGGSAAPNRPVIINEPPSYHSSLVAFDRSILPSAQHIHELLSHYFLYTNAAFPVFHIPTLQRQVDAVCFSDGPVPRNDIATVLLALAIGAASLSKISPLYTTLGSRAESLFHAAVDNAPCGPEMKRLDSLQMEVAHLIFVLYKPSCGNAWELAGSAARHATGMGLHCESEGEERTPLEQDMMRRLFWITYSIDVMTCAVTTRPPAISDHWVTTDLPSVYDDALITDTSVLSGDISPLKAASLQVYRLCRIQSEILTRLYTTKAPPPALWYDTMIGKLVQWRDTCPEGAGFANDDWQVLQYHATTSMLYRPSKAGPTPDRHATTTALTSSREVLKRSKDMYRMGLISFNWITMHTLFIQGMTYLHALVQARQNRWNLVPATVDVFLDIQACTSLMEGLAATTPGTLGLRNAFEAISEQIARYMMASSSQSWITPTPDPMIESAYPRARALDVFLTHPLAEMEEEDWDKKVDVVLCMLP
uniref:Xylanolytic transcriptional activator regulatory domain-containing protein n=1 Tax=Kwoniella bestiolae CBS 10118 TaxID=1296100 RepID=A0A1B9GBC0_9TREE|nr:hypothetical protein I302_03156 [Kwoniella bestiolae CBS 10118]OCF28300.1 hypothetical protein I302_03156 [Kwoniella bestiolae CBS 10118]